MPLVGYARHFHWQDGELVESKHQFCTTGFTQPKLACSRIWTDMTNMPTATRARITISINAEGAESDQELITLDVPLSMTLGDFKAMIESETKIPAVSQNIFLNGEQLRDNNQTLEAASINDGEMLAVIVSGAPPRQDGGSASQSRGQQSGPPDAIRIEQVRRQLISNPEQLGALVQQNPDLAAAINDPAQFRRLWETMQQITLDERQQRQNEIRLLNEDPFNVDNQKRIQEIIRREQIEQNLQYAYENNPAGRVDFSRLHFGQRN
jgi:DNA damage-inducible protein 1